MGKQNLFIVAFSDLALLWNLELLICAKKLKSRTRDQEMEKLISRDKSQIGGWHRIAWLKLMRITHKEQSSLIGRKDLAESSKQPSDNWNFEDKGPCVKMRHFDWNLMPQDDDAKSRYYTYSTNGFKQCNQRRTEFCKSPVQLQQK